MCRNENCTGYGLIKVRKKGKQFEPGNISLSLLLKKASLIYTYSGVKLDE